MTHLLQHHPLGATVPQTVHAVCCSLPTMRDVIGYEEKHPETVAKVKYAYPRFVFHDYVLQAMELAAASLGLSGCAVYLLPSRLAAEDCIRWLSDGELHEESDFFVVSLLDTEANRKRAKAYLQHTGLSISSRHAEDYLISKGRLAGQQPENNFAEQSESHVRSVLKEYLPTDALYLSNCGMNAFYASLRAVRECQAPRNRTVYIQLGWLYLDTQRILENFLGVDDRLVVQLDVFDSAALKTLFAEHGDSIAALVTELPTNPLVQTPDVELLDELCEAHGVMRIFDPTVAGIPNVDLLPHTDVLVTSLTKYAAHEGDVMIGAVAVNPHSRFSDELVKALQHKVEPPYVRDCDRLAAQIGEMGAVAVKQSENARELVAWLEAHPAVKRVWHPRSPESEQNFELIARSPQTCGVMFTIELNGDLQQFYDYARVVKGPSFGTTFTMMCPFMYLAHYDDVSCEAGREKLLSYGLNPDLIRVSAGTESIEEIKAGLEEGLGRLR
ncbi:MAG: PLP-dependent transferase [Verrucomicrobiota bacterium]